MAHHNNPIFIKRKAGRIGHTPDSKQIGIPSSRSYRYLGRWLQGGQIFSFSGPPSLGLNADIATDGHFHVILHSPELTDTSSDRRYLGGVLMPWRYQARQTGGAYQNNVAALWTPPGDTEKTLFSFRGSYMPYSGDRGFDVQINNPSVFEIGGEDFFYVPDASSRFYYGILKITGICPAALSIWTMPCTVLTATNAQILDEQLAPGTCIRGYTNNDRKSLGDIIHYIGENDYDEDYLHNNTRRCLFQWGHPVAVWSNTASYKHLADNSSVSTPRYKLKPQNLSGLTTGNDIDCYPAIIVNATGASVTNPAYVKLTTETATDNTWEIEIDSNGKQLLDYTDNSNDTLGVDAAGDALSIEMKAPSGGELLLYTVSLWEDTWYQ